MDAVFKVVLVIVPQVECDGTLVDDRAVAETRADRIDAAHEGPELVAGAGIPAYLALVI
jgi:hypothetical protein